MSEHVNIGVIGIGDHSNRSHIAYLTTMAEACTLTTFSDIDARRMTATNAEYGLDARGYTDWRDLVAGEDVDAVFIMTPDRFHTVQTVGAIAAGKHVFCEKPLASDDTELAAIKKVLEEAETKGLIVSTCHPRRFDPPFLKAKTYIENRAELDTDFGTSSDLGDVVGFDFNFDYHEPSKRGLHHSLMFDHLNHEVDAMHFLFGFGELQNLVKHYDGETEFKVTGQRTDGIAFSFTGARHRKERIYPEDMVIRFANGSLAIDLHSGKAVLTSGDENYVKEDEVFKTNYGERFSAVNQHFLRSVMGIEPPYISAKEILVNTQAAIDLQKQPAVANFGQ